MKLFNSTLLILILICLSSCKDLPTKKESESTNLMVHFNEEESSFTNYQKQLIEEIIINSEKEIRELLPNLPKGIKVVTEIVDWDITVVGGVTGRAETNVPPTVIIQISNKFPGGIVTAANASLRSTIFHEFHHLSLGWAIQDNRFNPEISIASVIEGLAEVFSEEYTGAMFEENHIPKNVDGDIWVKEILALPKDADYHTWMFQHPDGRTSIGYKTGNYLVRKAMANSGLSILELSQLSTNKILELAGY